MIDWNQVAGLRDEIGQDAFEEVADMVIEEVAETLMGLPPAGSGRAAALHGLRGAAMNIGMRDLAAACAEGEEAPDRVEQARLAELFGRSRAAFEAGRHLRSAGKALRSGTAPEPRPR